MLQTLGSICKYTRVFSGKFKTVPLNPRTLTPLQQHPKIDHVLQWLARWTRKQKSIRLDRMAHSEPGLSLHTSIRGSGPHVVLSSIDTQKYVVNWCKVLNMDVKNKIKINYKCWISWIHNITSYLFLYFFLHIAFCKDRKRFTLTYVYVYHIWNQFWQHR